jgi:uncharacterized protein YqeY
VTLQPADRWRTELRRRLLVARKDRDAARASVLRSAMSAIDNAETLDEPVPSAGAIADSAVGIGAADIARRFLSENEIRVLIRGEIDERHDAAAQFAQAGHADRAAAIRDEAAVLSGLLDELVGLQEPL